MIRNKCFARRTSNIFNDYKYPAMFFSCEGFPCCSQEKRTCFSNVSRSANINAFAEQENTGFDETAFAKESQTEEGHSTLKC